MPHRVVDAEYSAELGRIVAASADPPRLVVFDPEAGSYEEAVLPSAPTSLSLHPDGLSVALGHSGSVSVVVLSKLDRVRELPVSAQVVDVVLAGNGFVYAFQRQDKAYAIDIATGQTERMAVEMGASDMMVGPERARLAPGGEYVYGTSSSGGTVMSFDIARGPWRPNGLVTSQEGGIGSELWFLQDGKRMFTNAGTVFDNAFDMTADITRFAHLRYRGAVTTMQPIRSVSHSQRAKLIAVATGLPTAPTPTALPPAVQRPQLRVFEDAYLNLLQTVNLADFKIGNQLNYWEGKFLFFSKDGKSLYALVMADAGVPAAESCVLSRYPLADSPGSPLSGIESVVQPSAPKVRNAGARMLGVSVLDAAYSRALDRLVLLSADRPRLTILDPQTGAGVGVDLPLVGTSVALDPDGMTAVVGHPGWISVVDLNRAVVTLTDPVPANIGAEVAAANGVSYAFSKSPSSRTAFMYNRNTHATTEVPNLVLTNVVARLHPDATRLYAATTQYSPSILERYDVMAGGLTRSKNRASGAETQACNKLWLSEDGQRIFTGCGTVFRASSTEQDDMAYLGKLGGLSLAGSVDDSARAGWVAVSESYYFTPNSTMPAVGTVQLYPRDGFTAARTLTLDGFQVDESSVMARPSYVFFDAAGTKLYVVAEPLGQPGNPNGSLEAGLFTFGL